jgi:mRNA interferase MazF
MIRILIVPLGKAEISLSSSSNPSRGDVWLVNFDPTIGDEIRKTRPAVIVSSDGIGRLPVKLVAPITEWKDAFSGNPWHIRIDPDAQNGLQKTSAADALQLRGMDLMRFVTRLGKLSPELMEEMAVAIAIVVEYR